MESDVGIFWDVTSDSSESYYSTEDFARDLIVLSQSFCTHQKFNCAKIFGTFSQADLDKIRSLNLLGFEVVTLEKNFDGCCSQLIVSILLWLWDCERSRPGWNPCLILASRKRDLVPVLNLLKKRNVYIVLILDINGADRDIWKSVSNVIVNATGSSLQCDLAVEVPLTASSSSSDILGVQLSHFDPSQSEVTAQATPDRFTVAMPLQRQESQRPAPALGPGAGIGPVTGPMPMMYSVNSSPNDLSYAPRPDPPPDWRFEIKPQSIPQSTVTHNPQFPDAAEMMITNTTSLLQNMSINQAQFQTQNTSSASSSQIISRESQVLIKDEQRSLQEDLTFAFRSRNVQTAVSTLRKIYTKQCKSFRIPTILSFISQQTELGATAVRGPSAVYSDISFMLSCIQWCFGGQKGDNVESFTYKMNKNIARWLIKDIQRRDLVPSLQQEIVPLAISVVQHILRQVAELDLALDLLITVHMADPLKVLKPFIQLWSNSSNPVIVQRVRSFSIELGLVVGVTGAVETWASGQADRTVVKSAVTSSQSQPALGHGLMADQFQMSPMLSSYDDLFQFTRQTQPMTFSSSNDLSIVTQRLVTLLRKAPHGLLGARIPDIYIAEYGEPLQLQNRKLKDILLSLESVEMFGMDGPGDKLFRYVENHNNFIF